MKVLIAVALLITVGSAGLASAARADGCSFEGEAEAWATQAFTAWDRLETAKIKPKVLVKPVVHLFDKTCQYDLTPESGGSFVVGQRRFDVSTRAHTCARALGRNSMA